MTQARQIGSQWGRPFPRPANESTRAVALWPIRTPANRKSKGSGGRSFAPSSVSEPAYSACRHRSRRGPSAGARHPARGSRPRSPRSRRGSGSPARPLGGNGSAASPARSRTHVRTSRGNWLAVTIALFLRLVTAHVETWEDRRPLGQSNKRPRRGASTSQSSGELLAKNRAASHRAPLRASVAFTWVKRIEPRSSRIAASYLRPVKKEQPGQTFSLAP
jgi:hypothetical protein